MLPILVVLLLLAFYIVAMYNSLASLKVKITEAWSQIDVQLKRRVDLVTNLVETVKGYAAHEKDVFENVTKARSALINATNPKEVGDADISLTTALKSVFAVAEAYPDLKAQEGFIGLQKELSDTEDKVSYSRQFYNSVVRQYNEKLVVFPNMVLAGLFGFKQEVFFEAEEADKNPVKVQF